MTGGAVTTDIRSFQTSDFDVFVDAYLKTWGFELVEATSKEQQLSGAAYLAANLTQSDWVRVSVVDGRPAGLLCASFAGGSELLTWTPACLAVLQEAIERLKETSSGRKILEFVQRLHEVNAALLKNLRRKGLPAASPEVVYFIVHPDFRGRGAGKTLLAAFEDECRRRGVTTAYLFTDNHCSWQGYLRDGWKMADKTLWTTDDMVTYALTKCFA